MHLELALHRLFTVSSQQHKIWNPDHHVEHWILCTKVSYMKTVNNVSQSFPLQSIQSLQEINNQNLGFPKIRLVLIQPLMCIFVGPLAILIADWGQLFRAQSCSLSYWINLTSFYLPATSAHVLFSFPMWWMARSAQRECADFSAHPQPKPPPLGGTNLGPSERIAEKKYM